MYKKIIMIIIFILFLLSLFLINKYNDKYPYLERNGNNYIFKDKKRNIELIDAKNKEYNEISLDPIEFNKNDNVDDYLKIFKRIQDIYDYYLNNFNYKKNIKVIINLNRSNSYSFSGGIIVLGNKDYYLDKSVLMHEYTHLVIDDIVNLKTNENIKTIKEFYCDVMSILYTDKWFIGSENHIIRNIENPKLTNNPVRIDDENYNNDSHNNSTILSHIIYEIYNKNIFKDKLELSKIIFNSIHYLNDESDFKSVKENIINSSKEYGLDNNKMEIINKTFSEYGI